MGGKIVLPEPDGNIQKCIKNYFMTPKEISDFWKIFQKYFIIFSFHLLLLHFCISFLSRLDRGKTGFISLDLIYKRIEWKRSIITDCILELLDIEHGKP